jgi:hypothetical protein
MIRKYWRYSNVELAYIIPTHLNRTRLSQAPCDTCHHLWLSPCLVDFCVGHRDSGNRR